MAQLLYLGLSFAAQPHKISASSSKTLKLVESTHGSKASISTTRKGSANRLPKIQKLNLEVSPHRAVSAVRLMRIEFGGAFADLLNEKGKGSGENEMSYVERTLGFRTRELNDQDLRLVTDIVGGTIRWKRYLDHLISSISHDKDISSMEPLLLQILRVGFFEIVKLDMPHYAVVDENVRLAKVALRPGAGNMVNGILRKLAVLKENESLPLPKVEGDDRAQARALATLYSHPVWMVRRWTRYLGQEEAIKLMIWNNSEPSFSLRANHARGFSRADLVTQLNALKVPHKPSPHLDEFVRVKTGLQTVIHAGLLRKGLCSVQDESAGLVVSVVNPQPGDVIVDCCAAPGGKTLYMASHLRGQGMVFAVDVNRGRLRILKETAKTHQVDGVITTVHADLRELPDSKPLKCNKVLLDAPCSGLGVLSKRADLRWNRKLEDMVELKKLQDELLDAASKLVNPGGVLIYSTCSIDPQENDAFSTKAFSGIWPYFKLTAASAVMLCLEIWYSQGLVLLSGLLPDPTVSLDSISICMNYWNWDINFMLGLCAATSVRVSNELGAAHPKLAKFAVIVVNGTSVVISIVFCAIILIFRVAMSKLFTSDTEVILAVSNLTPLLAISVLLNGIQPILSGVAIGSGWQGVVAYVNLVCYYVIGLPLGCVLGFKTSLGVAGMWWGMIAGIFFQTVILIILTARTNWDVEVEKAVARVKRSAGEDKLDFLDDI